MINLMRLRKFSNYSSTFDPNCVALMQMTDAGRGWFELLLGNGGKAGSDSYYPFPITHPCQQLTAPSRHVGRMDGTSPTTPVAWDTTALGRAVRRRLDLIGHVALLDELFPGREKSEIEEAWEKAGRDLASAAAALEPKETRQQDDVGSDAGSDTQPGMTRGDADPAPNVARAPVVERSDLSAADFPRLAAADATEDNPATPRAQRRTRPRGQERGNPPTRSKKSQRNVSPSQKTIKPPTPQGESTLAPAHGKNDIRDDHDDDDEGGGVDRAHLEDFLARQAREEEERERRRRPSRPASDRPRTTATGASTPTPAKSEKPQYVRPGRDVAPGVVRAAVWQTLAERRSRRIKKGARRWLVQAAEKQAKLQAELEAARTAGRD